MNEFIGGAVTCFETAEHWIERVVVVAASGEVDMLTAPHLAGAIEAAAGKAPAGLIVDLTQVSFLASAGMNLLTNAHQEFSRSARFGVVADGPATSRPLKLTGVDTVVSVFRSLDDALHAFAEA